MKIDPLKPEWVAIEKHLMEQKQITLEKMSAWNASWDEVLALRGQYRAIMDLMALPYRAEEDEPEDY